MFLYKLFCDLWERFFPQKEMIEKKEKKPEFPFEYAKISHDKRAKWHKIRGWIKDDVYGSLVSIECENIINKPNYMVTFETTKNISPEFQNEICKNCLRKVR